VALPVNHAPVVAVAIADQTINEDSLLRFTVPSDTFSDPDGDNLTLSVTLADGSPLPAWLTFDPETNTFSGTPPQDYSGQTNLSVIASDGEFSATSDFTLTTNSVNDAPVITSGGGGAEASYTVAENTREVAAVTASDPDVGAHQRYTIAGGADANLFKINAKTGALVFKDAPDFETPGDTDHNGVYDVIVKVSDGGLTDTQTVHVTVSDVANELLKGNAGDNTVQGAAGADRLYGYAGDDTLEGGSGNDMLYGGLGTDTLDGGTGNDRLYGEVGNDTLEGGSGSDRLNGGAGSDTLLGGLGSDRLAGGEGQDTLTGGAGRDTFVFDLSPNLSGNVDLIKDFTHAQGDKISLSIADFTGFAHTGAISADQFYAAADAIAAHDASDRMIYNTSTGALYYDVDGQGGADAVQIATIQSPDTAHLAYSDILIIA
jgi:Ca2+-binding RTX toxin-like protein